MAVRQKAKKKGAKYIRLGVYPAMEVLPLVFTKKVRKRLREQGYSYTSKAWKAAASHRFWYSHTNSIVIPMGSHRYQLYAEKGCKCVRCDVVGTYFALERGINDPNGKFHLNLYATMPGGGERMMTKDHILPRSKGGKNRLENYQPMCSRCNHSKADKLEVPSD